MQLDQITARIAPRSAWQAMDLGVRLYQHWALTLTRLYLLISLPILAVLLVLAGKQYCVHALVLFWWLKPVWERPLLEFCAQALFSRTPSIAHILRTLPRHTLRGLAPWLLLRRLDPARSFHMPVTQLEQQSGDSYRQRTRVLGMGQNDHSGSLTFILLGFESMVTMGFIALLATMLPNQYYLQDFDWLFEQEGLFIWVSIGCYYLATCIITPLYVCCGFALYLNKRTWLEGWDLEVGLRQIGQRRARLRQTIMTLLLLLIIPVLGMSPSSSVWANTDSIAMQPETEQDPQQQATEILAGPDFTPLEIKDSWRFKDLFDDSPEEQLDDEERDWLEAFFKWLKDWLDENSDTDQDSEADPPLELPTMAEVLRFLLWLLVIAVIIWLATKIQALRPRVRNRDTTALTHTHVAGLDIRPESLPDDIVSHVLDALRQGDPRQALSLLYRASLSRLLPQLASAIEPGCTEYECLRQLRAQPDMPASQTDYLAQLTHAWISTAWAHRPVDAQQIERMARQWPQLFATPAEVSDVA